MRYTLAIFAFGLLVIAVWFLFAGFNIETTVSGSQGLALPEGMQGISNLQLMHLQLVDMVIGLVAGLGACVFFVGSAIVAAIQDMENHVD